jgi:sulfate transport system substrate-binding protein
MTGGIIPAFRDAWRARTGREVTVRASYTGSGAQARAVVDGFPADVVLLALEPDIEKIVKAGLIDPAWREATGNGGFVARTLVVIAVRSGNPRGIRDFSDLGRPGLEVLTPNPRTSGGAMWNLLAIYGAAHHEGLVRDIFRNVVVMDKGARESIVSFERGIGDAAVTYEQEVFAAWLAGRRYDYVVPPETLVVEIPAAVVDRNVDARGTRSVAEAFVAFLGSAEGQMILAGYGFRSAQRAGRHGELGDVTDPRLQAVRGAYRIDRLGGWKQAAALFVNGGAISRLVEEGQAAR